MFHALVRSQVGLGAFMCHGPFRGRTKTGWNGIIGSPVSAESSRSPEHSNVTGCFAGRNVTMTILVAKRPELM